jgi:hypothetical protein
MTEFESMLKDVVSVEPRDGFRLHLRFEDGIEGEVDIAALVAFDGVFAPLREKSEFDRVRVNPESGTIEWPCGADLDPVVLYSRISGRPIPDFGTAGFSK